MRRGAPGSCIVWSPAVRQAHARVSGDHGTEAAAITGVPLAEGMDQRTGDSGLQPGCVGMDRVMQPLRQAKLKILVRLPEPLVGKIHLRQTPVHAG